MVSFITDNTYYTTENVAINEHACRVLIVNSYDLVMCAFSCIVLQPMCEIAYPFTTSCIVIVKNNLVL